VELAWDSMRHGHGWFSGETKKRNLLVLIEADKITEETAFAFIYVNMLQFSLW